MRLDGKVHRDFCAPLKLSTESDIIDDASMHQIRRFVHLHVIFRVSYLLL